MTSEKSQPTLILATLQSAIEAKETLNKVSEAPKAEHSGFMVAAILLFADLSKSEAKGCRKLLEEHGIPKGTRQAVSLFTVGNPAHERLSSLLEDYEGNKLEDKVIHLTSKEITSYNKLKKYCVVVSDDVTDNKTARALANLSVKRYNKVIKLAEKYRLENEAEVQANKNKLNGKKLSIVASTISTTHKDKAISK